jgi:hypothetical protein
MPWAGTGNLSPKDFTCGHCGKVVGSREGYHQSGTANLRVYICPFCDQPTYFDSKRQVPGVAPGADVAHLPSDVDALYREARNSVAAGSNTAAVLVCRKLLMNLAVSQGAPVGQKFIEYVDYLADKGFVPPNGRGWVDHIRTKSNEANHEIVLMGQGDATDLITFSEMLLKFIFEFPRRVPSKK